MLYISVEKNFLRVQLKASILLRKPDRCLFYGDSFEFVVSCKVLNKWEDFVVSNQEIRYRFFLHVNVSYENDTILFVFV